VTFIRSFHCDARALLMVADGWLSCRCNRLLVRRRDRRTTAIQRRRTQRTRSRLIERANLVFHTAATTSRPSSYQRWRSTRRCVLCTQSRA